MSSPKSRSLLNKPLEKFRIRGFQNFWSYGMSIRAQTLKHFAKSEFLGFKVFRRRSKISIIGWLAAFLNCPWGPRTLYGGVFLNYFVRRV